MVFGQEDGREDEEDPARALYHSEVAISMPFGPLDVLTTSQNSTVSK